MALEAADDDLDVEIYDELDSYSKIFEELSLQLLEFGYQSDDDLTQHLLTGNFDGKKYEIIKIIFIYEFFVLENSILGKLVQTNLFELSSDCQ